MDPVTRYPPPPRHNAHSMLEISAPAPPRVSGRAERSMISIPRQDKTDQSLGLVQRGWRRGGGRLRGGGGWIKHVVVVPGSQPGPGTAARCVLCRALQFGHQWTLTFAIFGKAPTNTSSCVKVSNLGHYHKRHHFKMMSLLKGLFSTIP